MWIYITFVLIGFTKGDGYFESECAVASTFAKQACNLSTPDVTFSTTGQSIVSRNITSDKPTLWVGFTQIYTAFLYIGCADLKNDENITKTIDIRNDPGHCFSYCEYTFVGIGTTHIHGNNYTLACYCFPSKPSVQFKHECNYECDHPNKTLCGGDQSKVSVYQKVPYPPTTDYPHSGEEPRQCLAFNPGHTQHFFWSNCSDYFSTICKTTDNITHIYNSSGSWRAAIQECFTKRMASIDAHTNLSHIPVTQSQLWTGIIRSFSFYPSEDIELHSPDTSKQGFVHGLNLKFETQDNSHHALCFQGSEDKSCDNTTTTAPVGSTGEDSKTTTGSGTSTSTTETGGEESFEKQNDGNLTPVYVVVPLVLVIAAIAVCFLVWWKRKRNNEKMEKKEDSPTTKNNHQEQHGVEIEKADPVRHDYFILEPTDTYASISDADINDTQNEDYDKTRVLNTKSNGAVNDTGNVYNRLDEIDIDTYNHINNSPVKTDDTYNHTNNLTVHTDDTYNHTMDYRDDTTYNTAGTLSQSGNEDDTYNRLEGAGHISEKVRSPKQVADAYAHATPQTQTTKSASGEGTTGNNVATAGFGNGQIKQSGKFTFDELSSANGYEFAKEPATTGNYDLAKPPGV